MQAWWSSGWKNSKHGPGEEGKMPPLSNKKIIPISSADQLGLGDAVTEFSDLHT